MGESLEQLPQYELEKHITSETFETNVSNFEFYSGNLSGCEVGMLVKTLFNEPYSEFSDGRSRKETLINLDNLLIECYHIFEALNVCSRSDRIQTENTIEIKIFKKTLSNTLFLTPT